MAKFLYSNFGTTQLAAGVAIDAATIEVLPSQGALFPTPDEDAGERFALVLRKGDGTPEIMHCWKREDDVLSVLRGQEGTDANTWDVDDYVSLRTTAEALNAWAESDVGALGIADDHIFDDATERDAYFTTNPTEKTTGVFIAVGTGFQMWDGSAWRDMTAVMRGEQGLMGDVTTDATNAVTQAEAYAAAVLESTALEYDPDTYFYDFPMVCVGSDGETYRCMGTDVTALDIGTAWTASGSGTSEYYYTGSVPATKPDRVAFDGSLVEEGTVSSLTAGTWGWGDADTLGADTFYVRLGDGADPDSKGPGFVKWRNDLDPTTE